MTYRWLFGDQLGPHFLDDTEPVGGRWNFDAENREPPPKGADTLGLPEPVWPTEDDIDAEVRDDLDRLAAEG